MGRWKWHFLKMKNFKFGCQCFHMRLTDSNFNWSNTMVFWCASIAFAHMTSNLQLQNPHEETRHPTFKKPKYYWYTKFVRFSQLQKQCFYDTIFNIVIIYSNVKFLLTINLFQICIQSSSSLQMKIFPKDIVNDNEWCTRLFNTLPFIQIV